MLFTPVNTCKCMKRSVNNLVFPNLSPPPLHSQTPIFLPINFPLDFPDFMGIFYSPGWPIENHPPLQPTKLYRLQRVYRKECEINYFVKLGVYVIQID